MTKSDDPFADLTPVGESPDAGGWDGFSASDAAPEDRGPDEPQPPEADCAKYPLNDFGNGKRYLRHFGEDVMFVPRVGWHVWSGTHWRLDQDEIAVRNLAHRISDLIARETRYLIVGPKQRETIEAGEAAEAILDDLSAIPKAKRTDEQAAALKAAQEAVQRAAEATDGHRTSIARRLTHAKNAGNSNAINNMLREASVGRVVELEKLDLDPLVLNTPTCALRFSTRPGEDDGGMNPPGPEPFVEAVPHRRDMLITKIIPVDYDANAACPRFIEFIERILPVAEVRRFVQRWLALSATGLTGEQKFAFFYGSGANGKSVLMDLFLRLLGDYGASAKIESLTGTNRRGGSDATPDLMQLIGARFVRASEPDEGMRLQEALIKELTGGEVMLVRALHTNFVEFKPGFKLTISGNHKPEIRGGDDGIWRRVLLVPFDVQIPPEERDPDLGAKLWDERSGILNWLVCGLLDYLRNGLQVPGLVRDATKDYREESDPYAAFFTTCTRVTGDSEDAIPTRDLMEAFNFWLDENGLGAFRPRTITTKFSAMSGRWRHPETGKTFTKIKASISQYVGLRFVDPFGSNFKYAPRDAQGRILRNAAQREPEDA